MNEILVPTWDSLDSHQIIPADIFSTLSYQDAHREFKNIEKRFFDLFSLKPGTMDYTKYHNALSHYLRNGSHYIMAVDSQDQVDIDQISKNYSLLLNTMQIIKHFSHKEKTKLLVKLLSTYSDPQTNEEKFSNDFNHINVMHSIAENISHPTL